MPRSKRTMKGGDEPPNHQLVIDNAKLYGESGSKYVVFELKPGTKILCGSDTMLYTKGNISKSVIRLQSFGSAIMRLFGNADFFLEEFKCESNSSKSGFVAIGAFLPGDAIAIQLNPGESLRMSRGSFLACTGNVDISGTSQVKGALEFGQEEGFVLPSATCRENEGVGCVWLSTYGTFEAHKIEEGEEILLNNGMFLACNDEVQYDVERAGEGIAALLFGSGLGMKFTGPCTIYTQSKNLNNFIEYIESRTGKGASSSWFSGNNNNSTGGRPKTGTKKKKGKKAPPRT